jgi:glutaminyl-peptide cyclotransferase
MNKILYGLLAFVLFIMACNGSDQSATNGPDTTNSEPPPPTITHTVVNILPHDQGFFTEGLEFYNGVLYESSGSGSAGDKQPGAYPSAFGTVDLKTGKVNIKVQLDNTTYFGEGITFFRDKVYQLTWQSGIGFIYDAKTFKKLGEFKIPAREGWGLTHDSAHLIMSDGSSNLYFISPDSLRLLNIVSVTDNNGPVGNVNELEYINGFIYANQWQTPYILKIDPASGKVVGRINLENLVNEVNNKYPDANDLNGIAFDSANNKLYVTGKLWPNIYEIRLQ